MANLLQDRIALITGASRGIGAAVAKAFAREGAHVVLVARTVGALEELDDAINEEGKGKATLVPLDLLQLSVIDSLAVMIAERFGRLDVLVGNAGILGGLRPVNNITNKIWDDVMTANVTANWRLIRAFDPLLRQSDAGRAMFVTSGLAHEARPYWGLYAASKAALEMMVRTYAAEVAQTNVKVSLINPGIVGTNMFQEAFPGEDISKMIQPEDVAPLFLEAALPDFNRQGEVLAV